MSAGEQPSSSLKDPFLRCQRGKYQPFAYACEFPFRFAKNTIFTCMTGNLQSAPRGLLHQSPARDVARLSHGPESRALLLPHQRSSRTLSCSMDARFGSPSQMATGRDGLRLEQGRDERGEQRYDEVCGTLAVASSGGLGIDATVRGSAFITRHQLSRVRELEIITAATSSRTASPARLLYGHWRRDKPDQVNARDECTLCQPPTCRDRQTRMTPPRTYGRSTSACPITRALANGLWRRCGGHRHPRSLPPQMLSSAIRPGGLDG